MVKKPATILKMYPDAILADVTSRDDGFETVIPVRRVKAPHPCEALTFLTNQLKPNV